MPRGLRNPTPTGMTNNGVRGVDDIFPLIDQTDNAILIGLPLCNGTLWTCTVVMIWPAENQLRISFPSQRAFPR